MHGYHFHIFYPRAQYWRLLLWLSSGLGRAALKNLYDHICTYADGYLTPETVFRNLKNKTKEASYPLRLIDAVSFSVIIQRV